MRPVSGLEQAEVITAGGMEQSLDILPATWTPDGSTIICSGFSPRGADILLLDIASKELKPVLNGPANETHPQLSPDGKWLAYVSDESSQGEVYVTAYPGVKAKWQISRGGGTEPRWRGDGKELFFVAPDGTLHAVAISAVEGTFANATPVPLFRISARAPVSSTDLYNYTVTADGKRFLVNRYIRPASLPPFNIVLNATAELGK